MQHCTALWRPCSLSTFVLNRHKCDPHLYPRSGGMYRDNFLFLLVQHDNVQPAGILTSFSTFPRSCTFIQHSLLTLHVHHQFWLSRTAVSNPRDICCLSSHQWCWINWEDRCGDVLFACLLLLIIRVRRES